MSAQREEGGGREKVRSPSSSVVCADNKSVGADLPMTPDSFRGCGVGCWGSRALNSRTSALRFLALKGACIAQFKCSEPMNRKKQYQGGLGLICTRYTILYYIVLQRTMSCYASGWLLQTLGAQKGFPDVPQDEHSRYSDEWATVPLVTRHRQQEL